MKRREFIKLLGSTAVSALPLQLIWPTAAAAQNPVRANEPAADPAAQADPFGQVATVQGSATVTRGSQATAAVALRINDPVFTDDTLATGADSTLSVTFDDETTFSLSANTRIVVNAFIYQEGGDNNAAAFNVAVGTAAFVASLVAKTGDMKISTPTATLGIRGTTGVVDVPEDGGAGEPKIKLYPDADGHVGQIEVFNRQGGRLGTLPKAPAPLPSGRVQADVCASSHPDSAAGSGARPWRAAATIRIPRYRSPADEPAPANARSQPARRTQSAAYPAARRRNSIAVRENPAARRRSSIAECPPRESRPLAAGAQSRSENPAAHRRSSIAIRTRAVRRGSNRRRAKAIRAVGAGISACSGRAD